MSVGIDFGTTNSVVAVATEAGDIEVAQHGRDRSSGNFRSIILCFIKGGLAPGTGLIVKAGPDTTAAYLDHGSDCRLIRSVSRWSPIRISRRRTPSDANSPSRIWSQRS